MTRYIDRRFVFKAVDKEVYGNVFVVDNNPIPAVAETDLEIKRSPVAGKVRMDIQHVIGKRYARKIPCDRIEGATHDATVPP